MGICVYDYTSYIFLYAVFLRSSNPTVGALTRSGKRGSGVLV